MARFSISPVQFDSLSFLILDCPSDKSLPAYIPIFEDHNVTDLVRICEGSPYNIDPLTAIGIKVHDDMKFDDGTAPTKDIVARWLELNDEVFFESPTPDRCIAVHCVSGIGRAPVLVATSLIERGMDPLDSITYIRKARRGALNRVQIAFLDGYKKRKKGFGSKKPKSNSCGSGSGSVSVNSSRPPSITPSQKHQPPLYPTGATEIGPGRISATSTRASTRTSTPAPAPVTVPGPVPVENTSVIGNMNGHGGGVTTSDTNNHISSKKKGGFLSRLFGK